jgi:hypothetical protein
MNVELVCIVTNVLPFEIPHLKTKEGGYASKAQIKFQGAHDAQRKQGILQFFGKRY